MTADTNLRKARTRTERYVWHQTDVNRTAANHKEPQQTSASRFRDNKIENLIQTFTNYELYVRFILGWHYKRKLAEHEPVSRVS